MRGWISISGKQNGDQMKQFNNSYWRPNGHVLIQFQAKHVNLFCKVGWPKFCIGLSMFGVHISPPKLKVRWPKLSTHFAKLDDRKLTSGFRCSKTIFDQCIVKAPPPPLIRGTQVSTGDFMISWGRNRIWGSGKLATQGTVFQKPRQRDSKNHQKITVVGNFPIPTHLGPKRAPVSPIRAPTMHTEQPKRLKNTPPKKNRACGGLLFLSLRSIFLIRDTTSLRARPGGRGGKNSNLRCKIFRYKKKNFLISKFPNA